MMRARTHFHDEADRRTWQNPDVILAGIGVRPNDTFIDIGCGDGYFAIPAAKVVGGGGRVIGIDNDREALDRLERRAAAAGLRNVTLAAGDAEETIPCEACADVVFFGICLHDFRNAGQALANARRMVKPGGILIDLDWKAEPMELGPPLRIRFPIEKATGLIRAAHFAVESIRTCGPYHYLITAKPAVSRAASPEERAIRREPRDLWEIPLK
jgi:ubiquinone/menaquinone biosynthesis C-methylase UbiE